MALFTPMFKEHLGSTLSELLDKQDNQRAAAEILKGLQGKTGVELQKELGGIFKLIADSAKLRQLNEEAWKKIRGILNYIAGFDATFRKQLDRVKVIQNIQSRKEAFLKLLEDSRFAELCAKRMALSSQDQIKEILEQGAEKSAEIAGTRARQHSVGDWGQFGVMFVELLSDLVKITLVKQGYDVPEDPEKVSGGHTRLPYMTMPK